MKILKFLVPTFLKRIDKYLLIHYPIIWETKIHYVAFYSTILANLALLGVGYVYPIAKFDFPEISDLKQDILPWSYLTLTMVLAMYCYQQSFVRIKAYTLLQNLQRLGIYLFVVSSLIGNTFVLPHTIIYRVNNFYDAKEFKADFIRFQELNYLERLTNKIVFEDAFLIDKTTFQIIMVNNFEELATSGNEILESIAFCQQTMNNHNIEDLHNKQAKFYDLEEKINKINDEIQRRNDTLDRTEMEKERKIDWKDFKYNKERLASIDPTLPHALDFLKADSAKMAKAFVSQKQWHPTLRKEILDQLELHYLLHLRINEASNFVLATKAMQNLVRKYYAQYDSPNISMQDLENKLFKLMKYRQADFWFDVPNVEDNNAFYYKLFMDIKKASKDGDNLNTLLEKDAIRDFCTGTEGEVTYNTKRDYFNYDGDQQNKNLIEDLSNYTVVKAITKNFWNDHFKHQHYLGNALGILIAFLSLALLTVKLFTWKNIFISAFALFVSFAFVLVAFYDNHTFLGDWRDAFFTNLYDWGVVSFNINSQKNSNFILHWLFPIVIIKSSALFLVFAWWKNINRQWLQMLATYLISSALVCGGLCVALQKDIQLKYIEGFELILVEDMFWLYPLMALMTFGMYAFYNVMMQLPLKK